MVIGFPPKAVALEESLETVVPYQSQGGLLVQGLSFLHCHLQAADELDPCEINPSKVVVGIESSQPGMILD